MSGKWAEACDAYGASPHLEAAALHTARRLYYDDASGMWTPGHAGDILAAGSALRGWRKAQAKQGKRGRDAQFYQVDELLWRALLDITLAQIAHANERFGYGSAAKYVRSAEAYLRTAWKQEA